MAIAKICGITTPEALDAALVGGAAFVGLMFFPASPRRIDVEAAARLATRARGRAKIVAVTVDPDDALIVELRSVLRPDFLQLHGRESPRRVIETKAIADAGVIKVIPIAMASDLEAAPIYQHVADHLMFETKAPEGASRPGGHGATFDWSLVSRLRSARPWFLAGGLDPDNVAAAIAISGAPMVDVSSGVEGPGGLKDPALIGRFLAAAHASPGASS
ncbi:MAG TPA: phosphoribosylanthranilate isomerase [Caulobacteraceae bacterium]|jgi:phosphoribosylanthranilate isomerase